MKNLTIILAGLALGLSACGGAAAPATSTTQAAPATSTTQAVPATSTTQATAEVRVEPAIIAEVPDHDRFCAMTADLVDEFGFGSLSPSAYVLESVPDEVRLTATEAKALLEEFVAVAPAEIRSSIETLMPIQRMAIDLYEAADFDSSAVSQEDAENLFPDGDPAAAVWPAEDEWRTWAGANCVFGQDRSAQADLRNTLLSEKAVWTDTGAYTTVEAHLKAYLPTVITNTTTAADPGVFVSLSVAGNDDAVCLVQASQSGSYFALFEDSSPTGGTFYGAGAAPIACPPAVGAPTTTATVVWSKTGFPAVP